MSQFPRIRLVGDDIERGRQLGKQARKRINRSVEIYRDLFEHYAKWDWRQVVEYASRYRPVLETYCPHLLQEMYGISEGANLSLDDILALNVRTEIMFATAGRTSQRECTAFVAIPDATRDGNTLIGQNWDWKPETSDTMIIMEVERETLPNFVTVVEAGLLAKAGFNSAGIGLVTNGLITDLDRGDLGVPYHAMLRLILEARTISEAVEIIVRLPRASSANYLIAHKDGEAVDLEVAPGSRPLVYWSFPRNGFLAHTNHFLSSHGREFIDLTLMEFPNSFLRLRRVDRLTQDQYGDLSVLSLNNMLSDHFDQPHSICAHIDPRVPPMKRYSTVASLIIDLTVDTMWLADGNPCQTPLRELDYADLMTASERSSRACH